MEAGGRKREEEKQEEHEQRADEEEEAEMEKKKRRMKKRKKKKSRELASIGLGPHLSIRTRPLSIGVRVWRIRAGVGGSNPDGPLDPLEPGSSCP